MNDPTPNTETPILEGDDLRKTYHLGRVEVPVLHGASISIKEGEWVAILGASGSGKSTLLHLLAGLDRPDRDSGDVRYRGEKVELQDGAKTNRYRNRTVGFVFQFYHLLPELDVLENGMLANLIPRGIKSGILISVMTLMGAVIGAWLGVMAAGDWGLLPLEERTPVRSVVLSGACAVIGSGMMIVLVQMAQALILRTRMRSGEAADVARATLGDFGLSQRYRHRPRELSGGERQRVAIGRALGSNPDLLLADEPTGNLDEHTGTEILELLKQEHEEGLTIVMVTHDPKVASYANRIVRLRHGRVLADDEKNSIVGEMPLPDVLDESVS
jgi:ABC-type lipoprotein export system ATPase subunit